MLTNRTTTAHHTSAPAKNNSLLALLRLPTKTIDEAECRKSTRTSITDFTSNLSDHSIDDLSISPVPHPPASFFAHSTRTVNTQQATNAATPNAKFKTELCKNFETYGRCKWNDSCFFAHGREELKCKTVGNQYYKTKPCKHFHHAGFCPYAARCQYLHIKRDRVYQELLKSLDSKAGFCLNGDVYDADRLAIKVDKMQPRLALFQRLSSAAAKTNILDELESSIN